ncbi:MAG: hypothetical protein JWP47_2375 [Polaromonas sp.]|nr:hypothetical protein [Polaromonas sp.]
MSNKQNPRDQQEPGTGKLANDTNKMGEQHATQKNEGKRTPESRHDRETHVGSTNQVRSRKATGGGGGTGGWH